MTTTTWSIDWLQAATQEINGHVFDATEASVAGQVDSLVNPSVITPPLPWVN